MLQYFVKPDETIEKTRGFKWESFWDSFNPMLICKRYEVEYGRDGWGGSTVRFHLRKNADAFAHKILGSCRSVDMTDTWFWGERGTYLPIARWYNGVPGENPGKDPDCDHEWSGGLQEVNCTKCGAVYRWMCGCGGSMYVCEEHTQIQVDKGLGTKAFYDQHCF